MWSLVTLQFKHTQPNSCTPDCLQSAPWIIARYENSAASAFLATRLPSGSAALLCTALHTSGCVPPAGHISALCRERIKFALFSLEIGHILLRQSPSFHPGANVGLTGRRRQLCRENTFCDHTLRFRIVHVFSNLKNTIKTRRKEVTNSKWEPGNEKRRSEHFTF